MKTILAFILHVILFLTAWVLIIPLSIINYICVLFTSKNQAKGYFLSSAKNIDKFANREFRTLWNATLRKSDGYEFGHIDETISSVLGKNKRDRTLTKAGIALAAFLDFLDKNHCLNSINNGVNW